MRLPLAHSLGRGFRLVNSQLLVTAAGFGRRTAAHRQGKNAQDADLVVKRKRNDAPDAYFLARLLHPFPVDSDVTLLDDVLGKGPALHQANEEKETVDPHFFFSFASSAKACEYETRCSRRGG